MAAHKPVRSDEFSKLLETILKAKVSSVAVGVSGGPDSMALVKLLSEWAKKKKIQVHALTIDHGLRAESLKEVRQVEKILKKMPRVQPHILRWSGAKPKARLMEAARAARYELIADYCRKHKIKYLFLAHHQDDQAETFLFRLAKGSGLDGLASIRPVQSYNGAMTLLRPFLDIPKERLIATCKKHKIAYVKDPSNKAEQFARPRLRKSWKVLEGEGLTSKRLATTAARLERARAALEEITEKAFSINLITTTTGRIVLDKGGVLRMPEEIGLRVLVKAIRDLRPHGEYLPRMEKIEDLFADLVRAKTFRKRTLGGLIFARNDRKNVIEVFAEKA